MYEVRKARQELHKRCSSCFFCPFLLAIEIFFVTLPIGVRLGLRASERVSSATFLSEANNRRYSAAPRHTKNKLLSALGFLRPYGNKRPEVERHEHCSQKSKYEIMKKLTFLFLIILLPLMASAQIQAQDNLVDRVSRAVGVRLPDGYDAKVKEFVTKSELFQRKNADKREMSEAFTEQWIAGQMKTSWGIDKGNQLLFVWDAVYEQITKKNFYDGEDGNKKRLDEFEKVMDNIEACGKKFKEDFTAYMKQRSAEAEKRSAEYKRQSAEALTSSLKNLVWFINRVQDKNKEPIPPNEIQVWKDKGKMVFTRCKDINLDYKAILRKELGDDKKVAELLKFYGVE